MAWRAAVKIAYDGRDFKGSQRQPDELTVEGEVIQALRKIEAIASAEEAGFKTASRTDRGVSALGNVVSFKTNFKKNELLGAMNSASKLVYSHAYTEVPEDFNPRYASLRWYRYFLPIEDLRIERAERCARIFIGEHDFRHFCKVDERETLKRIERVESIKVGNFLIIDLFAREFLRNMVRRMVAAICEVGKGRATLGKVKRALRGQDFSFGLAPAENLILMDIKYQFEFVQGGPAALTRKIKRYEDDAFLRLAFIDSLQSRVAPQNLES